MKNLNLNQKITLKGITTNVCLLINSGYDICEISTDYSLQIPNKFDIISLNPELFVHKYTRGGYFTYRISSSEKCEFTYDANYGKYKIRAGERGIIKILKTES